MKQTPYSSWAPSTYPPSILLIKPNSTHRPKLKRRLEDKGYRVYQSDTTAAGLALACQNYFELIVFDGEDPGFDSGEAFSQLLLNDPQLAGAPKIILTTDNLAKKTAHQWETDGLVYWLSAEDTSVEAKLEQIIEQTHYLLCRYM